MLIVAFVFLGGLWPSVRAVLHGLIAVLCAVAASLPDRVLERTGVAMRWVRALSLLVLAVLIGLMPVPAGVLAVIAPGVLDARPDATWWSLALRPYAVPGEASLWVMLLGFGCAVCVWGAVRYRARSVTIAMAGGLGALSLVALVHAATGMDSVFGLIEYQSSVPVFFAPLVNGNHLAAVVVLLLPVVVGAVGDQPPQRSTLSMAALGVSLVAVAVLAAVGSVAALLVLIALLLVPLFDGDTPRGRRWLGVAAATVAGLLLVAGWMQVDPYGYQESFVSRRDHWSDALRMGADFWAAGIGGAGFLEVFPAYHTDGEYHLVSHVHSDPLEWVLETGVIGLGAALVAMWVLWPRESAVDGKRARRLTLGLVGLELCAAVEFPLQVPAVALATVAVAALRLSVFQPRVAIGAGRARAWLAFAGLLQLPFAAWQARTAIADRAVAEVRAFPDDPAAAEAAAVRLARWAPWSPEIGLYEAWRALAQGDHAAAADAARLVWREHPDDPAALRRAGRALANAGELEDALVVLQRAADRNPNDYRSWKALARVARAHGDVVRARDAWDHALSSAPPDAALVREAYTAFPEGLYWVDALADGDVRNMVNLGALLSHSGDPAGGWLAFEQAGIMRPEVFARSMHRIAPMLQVGQADAAEAYVRGVLAAHPDDEQAWVALGSIFAHRKQHDAAVEAFLTAADRSAEARVRAVRSTEATGELERALALVRRFDLEGLGGPDLGLEAARLRFKLGDLAGCRREIEEARVIGHSKLGDRASDLLQRCTAPM